MTASERAIERLALLIAHSTFRRTRIINVDSDNARYMPAVTEILTGDRANHSFVCVQVTGSLREALLEPTVCEFIDSVRRRHTTLVAGKNYPDTIEGLTQLIRDITAQHPKTVVLIMSKEKAEQQQEFLQFFDMHEMDARVVIIDVAVSH